MTYLGRALERLRPIIEEEQGTVETLDSMISRRKVESRDLTKKQRVLKADISALKTIRKEIKWKQKKLKAASTPTPEILDTGPTV